MCRYALLVYTYMLASYGAGLEADVEAEVLELRPVDLAGAVRVEAFEGLGHPREGLRLGYV